MKQEAFKAIILAILITAVFLLLVVFLKDTGLAEPLQEEVWVLCMPDSYVTLRTGPGKSKPEFGGCQCGAKFWTDGKQQNGFLHVLEVPAENDTGWISARYIIYDRPEEINQRRVITGKGRVACRKWVAGKVKDWIMPGDTLTVYWMSASWAVTSRGYIKSEYIGEVVQDDLELPGVR